MTRGRYRWALAVVAVSAFMTTMDNTVVFAALPTIMTDLDMSSSAKDWVATGYILMFSCLMITGGRLTDVFGCRLTFTTGMIVFTAASAVCGLAQSSDVLILARIVQGAGAALVLPATQVMVTVGRNDKQRSIGNIAFIGAASSATALGPTIGGVIVEHWHWGWIFLINIVPGILVTVLGLFVLTSKGENKHARIDLPGVLISATMLFAFIYGLESGNKLGWSHPSVLSVFALGVIALACFVLVESWAPDPMIDLRFFRNRVFTGGLMSQMLYGIGFNGMMFYSQPFLQRFLGFSPPEAGLVMLPPALAIMVLTPVAFLLAAKIGPRPAIGAGMALMGLGMFLFSTLQTGDGYAELMPGVMLVGVGAALGMPLVMYVLKAVPERRAGVASGVINVIREASGAFGIAIVGLLIHNVPEEGASAGELETFRDGTSSGLILGAGLVLIGGVISALTLPSRRGWLGPKHGRKPPIIPDAEPEAAPELVPAATAGLAVATASPPNAPVPLPPSRDGEDIPDRVSTPGPHWWADTEPKPADDTFTWSKQATPWPAPPTTPATTWEDWPTETAPSAAAPKLRHPEPSEDLEDSPVTSRPESVSNPTEALPDTHSEVGVETWQNPWSDDEGERLDGDAAVRAGQQFDDLPAPATGSAWFAAEDGGTLPGTGGGRPIALPATEAHASPPSSPGRDGHWSTEDAEGLRTATETAEELQPGNTPPAPIEEPAWPTAGGGGTQDEAEIAHTAQPVTPGPATLQKRWWDEDESPGGDADTWADQQFDDSAAPSGESAWFEAESEETPPDTGEPPTLQPTTAPHTSPPSVPAGDDHCSEAGLPGAGDVVEGLGTGEAAAPGVEVGGSGVGVAGAPGGGTAGVPGVGDGGGRPAPPEGWYEPYVPEDEPGDEPQVEPRSDAW